MRAAVKTRFCRPISTGNTVLDKIIQNSFLGGPFQYLGAKPLGGPCFAGGNASVYPNPFGVGLAARVPKRLTICAPGGRR